ncbi:hypothetical protein J6590_055445 [Homalodisca vitripennis]|nr:hypothetical protein J6590_055445 [Homalodisca vitripennis]
MLPAEAASQLNSLSGHTVASPALIGADVLNTALTAIGSAQPGYFRTSIYT